MGIESIKDEDLFGLKPTKINISVKNSKELLQRGISYFFGTKGVWLPEYDSIAEWLSNNKGKGLLCLGDSGRGKTFMCERILLPIIENQYRNLRTCTLIGYTINENYGKGSGTVNFIDDIGVESEGNLFGEKINTFNQIINDAERNDWLLIITTNLTTDELKEKYGERAFDRLRSLTKLVVFKGKSLRG